MPDVWNEGAVLRPYRVPVGTVHLGVVEEVALVAPRLPRDLRPLRARVYPGLELCDVDWAIANSCGLVGAHDAPTSAVGTAAGLVQQLLAVRRERVRPNALDER